MKCATLTFHRTTNYGAMLQTYALQQAIKKMGVDTEVIDYRSPTIESRYKNNFFSLFLHPRTLLSHLRRNSYIRDNRKSFASFSQRYIKTSEVICSNKNDLEKVCTEYDRVIVGSDQVWNPRCTGWDENYFLPFVKQSKRASYAASFGFADCESDIKNWLSKQLNGFKSVSVREPSGAVLYKKITGDDVVTVLDPTFLLKRAEWEQLADNRATSKPYVLLYLLAETPSIISFAKQIAKKTGKEVIYINERLFPVKCVRNMYYVSPTCWLSLFLNADVIVTNSFHGIAFSSNLNKQFWVELLPPPALVNARIVDLLNNLGLSERIISESSDISKQIDYNRVNPIIENLSGKSLDFLKSVFD